MMSSEPDKGIKHQFLNSFRNSYNDVIRIRLMRWYSCLLFASSQDHS